MSINSNCYYEFKRRFLKAKEEKDTKERAWLLENLSIELLYALAEEWLNEKGYNKEVKIIKTDNKAILPSSWFTDEQTPEATQRLLNLIDSFHLGEK
jgi:hypothetical protein